MDIRPATEADKPQIWRVLEPVFREGKTYPVDHDIDQNGAFAYWFAPNKRIYVCEIDGEIVGTFYICPNSTGPADHICNCGYATAPEARGKGVATAMCKYSFEAAKKLGYRGMQYNLVVTTNSVAVHLWQKLGMTIIGTAPSVFRLPDGTYADAHIMFKSLL